ncbi:multiple monosaccharide ABC transporter substrate-binding protein [Anaerobium acetethylicum]|uniref:Putative multiple sugar transport system substrate-binding protein n=1 Tax=Anaerobium acetethylicum TaxID=1619234 RepID=A0A1D3TQH9_9FIRM|nr:multiple monosaccharide ABC transporter substrate-binding protein [Anaerobium acetethylicum]SCP95793.1 putative multiple sugar transport system substrate-binding protein [Anaerobium acetethylicum]
MKRSIRKVLSLCVAMVMVFSLAACGSSKTDNTSSDGSASTEAGKKIGVAMPTKDLQRWNQDGANMKSELEAAGYKVDLQYANNEIATQVSQIENMITAGCETLVIAAIDGSALGTVLAQAKDAEIQVIAYDRLIMESDAVSYYATFDNYMVGTIQGTFIRDALDLENAEGPFNIELFTGSSDDNNARFFFGGAIDILQEYIDSGKLVVVSGQTEFEEVATPNWSTEEAQKRMDNIITAYYADGEKLDAVLSSNDSVANGITNSLVSAGYTGEDFPVLTGQDCDITSVKNILAGKQSMSIFKDTRTLASQVVKMVDAIMQGTEVPVNDTESYDNGTGIIPTFLCEPVFADKDNYKELLIDSGYYTEDKLK